MATIQERINSLRPYVVGFRFDEKGNAILDCVLKKTWKLPPSELVQSKLEDGASNYYTMFAKPNSKIGLDELFDYVEYVKDFNKEKELKLVLYTKKVSELKELFRNNDLKTLNTLTFQMNTDFEELEEETFDSPESEILDLDEVIPVQQVKEPIQQPKQNKQPIIEQQAPQPVKKNEFVIKPVPIQEPKEADFAENEVIVHKDTINKIMEINSKVDEHNIEQRLKTHQTNKVVGGVELPPKKPKVELEVFEVTHNGKGCNCGPNDACPICINDK